MVQTLKRVWSLAARWPAFAVIVGLTVVPLEAQILNRNLIANPGAEEGAAANTPSDPPVASIPGWTSTGLFTVGVYGDSFLSRNDNGPVDRGAKLFYGGTQLDIPSSATQTVDLAAAAADIDAGRVKFYASSFLGLLGGSNAELQNTFLKIEFQDASGAKLLETVLHGPQVEEVNIAEGLLLRTSTGFLPAKRPQSEGDARSAQ